MAGPKGIRAGGGSLGSPPPLEAHGHEGCDHSSHGTHRPAPEVAVEARIG